MKKIYLFFTLCLPIQLIAQPTINHMLDYHIGEIDTAYSCNSVAPGPGGPSQTWNFASLTKTNTFGYKFISNPSGSPIPSANVVKKGPDSTYAYYTITANNTSRSASASSSAAMRMMARGVSTILKLPIMRSRTVPSPHSPPGKPPGEMADGLVQTRGTTIMPSVRSARGSMLIESTVCRRRLSTRTE